MSISQLDYPKLTLTEESLAEFWAEIAAQTLDWMRPWDAILEGGFKQGDIKWFKGGLLNVSVNCLDRHLSHKANQPAIIWEGDEEKKKKTLKTEKRYKTSFQVRKYLRAVEIHNCCSDTMF